MSALVDVLAVLDAEIARETEGDFVFPRGRQLVEVRAAAAELMGTCRQLRAVLRTARGDDAGTLADPARRGVIDRALQRADAALANCGGAK